MLNRVISDPSLEQDISNLHEALRFLLPPQSDFIKPAGTKYTTPASLAKLSVGIDRETVLQLGALTLDAVELFKLQEGLASPEDDKFTRQRLDTKTAEKMNAYLEDMGAFDPPDLRLVHGQVSHADTNGQPGLPALNVAVQVFDDSGSRNLIVGNATTDGATGQYELSITFSPTQRRAIGIPVAGGSYLSRKDLERGTGKRIRADLVLAAATTDLSFKVSGTVTRSPGGAPVEGAVVSAYLMSSGRRKLTSSSPTDAQGRYSLSSTAAAAAPLMVGIEDAGNLVVQSGDWPNSGDVVRDLVLVTPEESDWVITGTVRDLQGNAAPNRVVRAVDRDLRTEQALGEDLSDAQGRYRIVYTDGAFQDAELGSAEIIVRAYANASPGSPALVESPLQRQVERVCVVDLTLPAAAGSGISEFERCSAILVPLLRGQGGAGADLPPSELNGEDETFLIKETALAEALVHAWSESARLLKEAQALLPAATAPQDRQTFQAVGWPFFFGWRCTGLATGLWGVLNAEPLQWSTNLREAHEQRWTPVMSEEQAKVLLRVLASLQDTVRLDPRYATDTLFSAVSAMQVDLPPRVMVSALDMFKAQGLGALSAFGVLAQGDPSLKPGLLKLAKTLRVYALTDGDAALLPPLVQRLTGDTDGLAPLAALGSGEWLNLAQGSGLDGAAAEKKASALQIRVELLQPADALLARIAGGDLRIAGHDPVDLGQLLGGQLPAVGGLLQGQDTADTLAFKNEYPALADQLRDLGRWVKGGAGLVVGQELIDLGAKSPGWLTNYGDTVIGGILGTLPPEIRDFIKDQRDRFGVSLGSWFDTHIGLGLPPITGLPYDPFLPPVEPLPPQVPGMSSPTLRGMFGDLDDCLCRPCESVLGQGAYLVDLLNLLKREVPWRGAVGVISRTGLDLLRSRRPDLLDLELNCDNAEVLLPHIDLALEAMEWLASAGPLTFSAATARPIAEWFRPAVHANLLALTQQTAEQPLGAVQASPDALDPRLWRVTDGLRTWLFEAEPVAGNAGQAKTVRLIGRAVRRTEASPDPRVAPAHRVPAAYQALASAVFPWSLPYDVGVAESRLFVDRMAVSRTRLLALDAASTPGALANEWLGLTAAERGLLQSPRTGDALWQAWGFASAAAVPTTTDPASGEVLTAQIPQQLTQRASILIARSGLDLDALEAALASGFVGGLGLSERAQCKTSLMRVAPPASPEALDRLHRLVRLWRKLPGWTLEDLDAALAALNPLPTPAVRVIDAEVLTGLACLQEARQLLELPLATLLGMRVPLSTVFVAPGTSLFAGVFLSSRVGSTARALFASVAQDGQTSTALLGDHLGPLAAALGTDASGVMALLPVAGSNTVTHAALTAMHRHLTLARAVGLSPTDMRLLIALTGIEPLGDAVPASPATSAQRAAGFAALVAFAKAAARFGESGLDTSLVADVLLPAGDPLRASFTPSMAIKTDDLIQQELRSLRVALREARPAAQTETVALKAQTEEALTRVIDNATARRVVSALSDPQAVADTGLVDALSGDAVRARDPFGLGPLTGAQATALLTNTPAQTIDQRLNAVLGAAGDSAQRGVLAQTVGRWTGLGGPLLAGLLQDRLKVDAAGGGVPRDAMAVFLDASFWSAADTAALPAEVVTWAKRLDRLMAMLAGMDAELALSVLNGRAWATQILPPAGASAASRWQTLASLLDLRWLAQATQVSEAVLREHVRALDATGAANNLPLAATPLARRLGLQPADALAMLDRVSGAAATLDLLRQPTLLRPLAELAAIGRPWHATAQQLASLAGGDPLQVSQTARQLLAAHDGAEAWPAILTELNNALRKQQRDALVAYLQPASGAPTDTSLHEKLLIDPQVQPCFMTTRITQAVASVQLLIQRVLFGLEVDVMASDTLRNRWSWMRSYRLWEANRKVFLYPENWLFPELRDDKSPGFRRLESTLSQGELTHERAGQAFGQFLADVNEVGQMQVLGMFEDTDAWGATSVQHRTRRDLFMVGRNPNPPYTYHWRTCQNFGKRWMEWSAWERIELDIQGDHVMPFMAHGRFHVAWPLIQKQVDPATQTASKWQIELAWSHFDGLVWRKVSTSRDASPINVVAFETDRSAFAFRPQTQLAGTPPVIHAYVKLPVSNATLTLEPAPSPVVSEISAPPGLLADTGIDELSQLLSSVRTDGQFDKDCIDLLEFYCVRMHVNAPAGYVLIPIREVLLDSSKLAWHRGERGSIFAKPIVDALTYTLAEIKSFVTALRQYGNPSWPVYVSGSWSVSPYANLINKVLDRCSSRTMMFRAWVRLRGNADDLLELHAADGAFRLQIQGVSKPLTPGALSEPSIKHSLDSPQVSLTWTPTGSTATLPSTASIPLVPVAVGKSALQTLHFEINDPNNLSGLRARLQDRRAYKQVQRFLLQATGTMSTQTGNGTALEFIDGNSDVWMNGLQETAASNQAYGLTLRNGQGTNISVFDASNALSRYWIVGAAAPNATALKQTSIWHFKEGITSCCIDLSPDPVADSSASGVALYPSAWHKGDMLTKAWYEDGRLPSASAQRDDFGAAALPRLSTTAKTWLPQAVLQGGWPFDNRMPGACYNWEVYFHAPLLIADHLSKQQRFEDAERWLRQVFDPTRVEPGIPESFLPFRVFCLMPRGMSVGSDLKALAKAVASNTASPPIDAMKALISQWRSQPYRPFMIARRRHVAFLWRTVFSYLDNLLAWADSLFRRDTREAIGEAAQLYVLAARILGPRPLVASARRSQTASSYADLAQKWDDFSNAWFDAATPAQTQPSSVAAGATVSAADFTPAPEGFLLFCIPFNDKLLSYWNLVEERLFNVRHCRNIEGIARDLPLTAPPIDPELLVRATAAGLDIADVVNGLFARPLPYRYSVVVARALDLANDVRAFGSALLSALEKRDAERLAQLRSTNEIDLLQRVGEVRQLQIDEARRNMEALRASRTGTAARFEQLQRQLGNTEVRAPSEQETIGEESSLGRLAGGTAVGTSKWGLIVEEQRQLDEQGVASSWSDADSVAHIVSAAANLSASATQLIPPLKLAGVPDFLRSVASASETTAQAFRAISAIHQTEASRQASSASHIRRRDEWAHQSNQALRELRQIDKQLLANEIRIALAQLEASNHAMQLEQAEAINSYLTEKFTNTELYEWMASTLSNLHTSAYRMALDMARQAERASARELGVPALNGIRNDYWTGQRARLLAGERLLQDLKRVEIGHLEQNRREHELTRHISLRLLDPVALRALKTTGTCSFSVPEWLFDMDMPGHYMRRIKMVSLSMPSVVGPYSSVNAKLTLLRSDLRHAPSAQAPYPQNPNGDDPRFTTRFGATESIVTSSGRDDSGLFESNLRDERYLPFENEGAISRWQLDLPKDFAQFDHETLSDVVLHFRYTARDGGESLATAASASLPAQLQGTDLAHAPLTAMVSLKSEFYAQWARWEQTEPAARASLAVTLSADILPYWMRAASLKIPAQSLQWIALRKVDGVHTTADQPLQAALSADGTTTINVPDSAADVLLLFKVRS